VKESSRLDLEGKIALVTGASRGLGSHIARGLRRHGAKLVLVSVQNAAMLDKVAEELGADRFLGDVSDWRFVEKLFECIENKHRTLNILVNCAGIFRNSPVDKMAPELWNQVIATNLNGAFHCSRLALPLMKKGGFGRIVNLSSVVGVTGTYGGCNYAASKAGLVGLTKSVAREVGDGDITANVLCLGYFDEGMGALIDSRHREYLETKRIPKRRFGRPEELVEATLFLCSPASSYINGAVIVVDGGYLTT